MQHAPSTRTTAWTEVVVPFTAALVLAAGIAGAAALSLSLPVLAVAAVLVALLALTAGHLTTMGGLLAGLCAAALAIGTAETARVWESSSRGLDLSLVASFVLLGLAASLTGQRVRRIQRDAARATEGVLRPVEGTLGTLRHADGLAVLDAEMVRARLHGRPLALAVVTLEEDTADLHPSDAARARRSFLRSLVAELRLTDVAFVTDQGELAVIMPETHAGGSEDTIASSVMGAAQVTFAARDLDRRLPVCSVIATSVRIAAMPPDHGTPEHFLAAARRTRPAAQTYLTSDLAAGSL